MEHDDMGAEQSHREGRGPQLVPHPVDFAEWDPQHGGVVKVSEVWRATVQKLNALEQLGDALQDFEDL
jgi:hypothetical protein